MALATRPVSSPTSLSGGRGARMPAGLKNIYTTGGPSIEEMSPAFGVGSEETAEMFHEYGTRGGGDGRSRGRQTPVSYRNPEQPSQSFTNLVEHFSDQALGGNGPLTVGSVAVAAILGRAIDAYEKTAVVISATHESIMGGVLSVTL